MATKRPSFLKRQKEQKRHARAAEKREARRERKQAKSTDPYQPAGAEFIVEEAEEATPAGSE